LGVICTPDIVSAALTGRERFVIIACDGLWNNLPSKDAVAFVGRAASHPIVNMPLPL
jgi:serine/threonine protein phosphatase PrpC